MNNRRLAFILSIVLIFLSAFASTGGLLIDDLYRDSDTIKTAWFGNDLVTLVVAIPVLSVSLFLQRKGSQRALVLWIGLLGYMVYNYAFYLFGAVFNSFFLIYVAVFSISIYALILALLSVDVITVKHYFSEKTPVKIISIFLLFISLPLAIAELGMCINALIRGESPAAPPLIFALDLSVVVPNTALAAVLLWKKRSWGYMLTAIMLVKAFAYGLVLSISTALVFKGNWDPLMPFYVFIATGGLIFLFILLRNLKVY